VSSGGSVGWLDIGSKVTTAAAATTAGCAGAAAWT